MNVLIERETGHYCQPGDGSRDCTNVSKCAMANRGCFSAGRLCRPGRESKAASKHGAFKAVSRSLIQGSASVGSDGESVQEAAEAAEAGGQRPPESSPLPRGAGGRSFPVRPREAEARPVCCVAPRAEWPGPGVPCGVCPLCGQQCPAPPAPCPHLCRDPERRVRQAPSSPSAT